MNTNVFQILMSLWDGPRSASEMLAYLGELDPGMGKPPLATLYRGLNKAQSADWLEIAAAENDGGRGRPRQSYRLTAAGRAAARGEAARLERLVTVADQLFSESEAS